MKESGQGEKRSILVAGCGAIGSVFACLLAEAGHRVCVLGRRPLVAAASSSGLRVSGIWGEHRSTPLDGACEAAAVSGNFDAVLVTCKSYDTESLLAELGDRAVPGGVAVSLQNGLGNLERLEAVYGPERVLGGRVIFGAEVIEPGHARVTVEAEPVLLGSRHGRSELAAEWASVVDRAGIACRPTGDIEAALWGKVLYNAALNPLGALLGVPYGELARDADRRWVMDRVIEEAYAVARAEGVALPWKDAGEYRRIFYDRLVPATAGHRSSMLQDLQRGRTTEIDAICGEVCRRGAARGVDTPLNRLLSILVRERSAGR